MHIKNLIISIQSTQVMQNFENLRRRTRADVEGTTNSLRSQLVIHQNALYEIVSSLLKGKGESRPMCVKWLCEAVALNVEAEKERPDRTKKSSNTFLINVSYVMLRLAAPFIMDKEKRGMIK